jgi:uncharacterized protein
MNVARLETAPALIEFMLDSRNYPERTSGVAHVQTHISHVFLCDDLVYKIKKPVNFGFVDFTTLRSRHYYCEQEVALNSRLAPDTYLGVETIYKKSDRYSFDRMTGGRISEYAVKMKKIPLDCLLYSLIEQGMPLYGELEPVGHRLALFHREARVYKGQEYGRFDTVKAAAKQNFEQIEPHRGITIDCKIFDGLAEYTAQFLEENKESFSLRKKTGWVRDGHGDLHSQHICLAKPPIIFDCIEFNKSFRIADVLQDIAFLIMDLEYRARFDLSSKLLRAYFAEQQESMDGELVRFYKVYRAVVRGKVDGLLAQGLQDGTEKEVSLRAAREYFHLAEFYVNQADHPFNPIVFMGLSGSGKSTIAKDFCMDSIILRSDKVRKAMTGVGKAEHRYAEFGSDIYSNSLTRDVYCSLLERAIDEAKKGRKVVVDATYLKKDQRRNFCETCIEKGLNPFFVHCIADEKVLRDRIAKRLQEGTDVSDADINILEQQIRDMEEPVELPFYRVLRLNTEAELHHIIGALKEFL